MVVNRSAVRADAPAGQPVRTRLEQTRRTPRDSAGGPGEGFANDTHAPLHAGNRDRVVDRQELGQQRCGGRIRQVRRTLDLQVFEFRRHARWHHPGQRAKRCSGSSSGTGAAANGRAANRHAAEDRADLPSVPALSTSRASMIICMFSLRRTDGRSFSITCGGTFAPTSERSPLRERSPAVPFDSGSGRSSVHVETLIPVLLGRHFCGAHPFNAPAFSSPARC